MLSRIIRADEGVLGVRVYHMLNLGVLWLTPVALVSPPPLTSICDTIIALAFPIHGHIGMNYVLTDYVPKVFGKGARGPARVIMLGVTTATTAGLLKLNMDGPGVTGALKALWTK
ncbi:hypothetical protein CTAYLR_004906 [Chrysophaeum taylorii]|uniref:Succinate dehydrogenase [ubiquinone] cytochrome b small subunit n=1 Tax=Chrysophaeum taylorii TaxID=2483200 RepID=A0AAD7XRU3_9STRA|nr:hypothetical protein CTAYLR_004906 [Chrysophaeum taylorii]